MIARLRRSLSTRYRQRHRLMAPAIVVGLLTGLVSVAFHLALDSGEALRDQVLARAGGLGAWGPWLAFAWIAAAIAIAGGMVLQWAPESAGSGIPHLKAVILGRRDFRWPRVLLTKFVSTVVGISGGLLLGREGPSVQMGGAVGQAVARLWPGKITESHSALIAAGGGAGLAAAFNAPLASLVFVLEELEWRCGTQEFFTAAIACLVADMTCRALLGQNPAFHLAVTGAAPLNLLITFLPLGILSGLLAGLFNFGLLGGQRLIALSTWPRAAWWALLGVMVLATAWHFPALLGSGHRVTQSLLEGDALPLSVIPVFFLIRFVLTLGSSSSGVAGGIFLPCLVLGSLLGLYVGEITEQLFPLLEVDTRLYVVAGMATFFTGVVRAPLTGIVLIIEMTDNYDLIMPLFVGCFAALLVADWIGVPPIYDALLDAMLKRDATEA